MATKIGTIQNPEKTEALLPRTCLKAIADKNGDYISEDVVKSDIDALKNGKVASMDSAITSLSGLVINEMGAGYIRFENGFQVCWGQSSYVAGGNAGDEANSGSQQFAKPFNAVPRMSFVNTGYAGGYYTTAVTVTSLSFTAYAKINHAFSSGTITQNYIAVGTWK